MRLQALLSFAIELGVGEVGHGPGSSCPAAIAGMPRTVSVAFGWMSSWRSCTNRSAPISLSSSASIWRTVWRMVWAAA
jgi:hypothetical protein